MIAITISSAAADCTKRLPTRNGEEPLFFERNLLSFVSEAGRFQPLGRSGTLQPVLLFFFIFFLNVNDKFCATLDQMDKLEFSGGFAKLQLNDPAPGFYLLQLTDSKAGRFTFKFTVN